MNKEHEARFENLHEVFKRRIRKFRKEIPDFQLQYEHHEVLICEHALKTVLALESKECTPASGQGKEFDRFAYFLARLFLSDPGLIADCPPYNPIDTRQGR